LLVLFTLAGCGCKRDQDERPPSTPKSPTQLILGEWRVTNITSIFLSEEVIKYFPPEMRSAFKEAKEKIAKEISTSTFHFSQNGDYRIEDMNRSVESGKYEIRHEGKGIDFKPDDPNVEVSKFDIVELNSKKMRLLLEIPLEGEFILPMDFIFEREGGTVEEKPRKRR
jgi:hypothetical protein